MDDEPPGSGILGRPGSHIHVRKNPGRVLPPGKGRPPLPGRAGREPGRLHTNLSTGCSAVPGIPLPLPGRGAGLWHRPVYRGTLPLEQGDRPGLYFPCDRSPYSRRGGPGRHFRPSRQQSAGPEVLRSLRVPKNQIPARPRTPGRAVGRLLAHGVPANRKKRGAILAGMAPRQFVKSFPA